MNSPVSSQDDNQHDATREEQLSAEDMERVRKYLSTPIHSVERKPFRPWVLIAGVWVLVVVLGLLSWAISYIALVKTP